MANTFNKYYLDDNGLRALIAKIKANDNQLAALIGLPENWTNTDTTADGFKSVISKLEEDYKQADNEVKAYIEELLGYNDSNWPTKDVAGEQVKLTVDERLKGLSEAIATVSDAVDAAFNSVDVVQDNANQSITLTFSNAKGDNVVKTIDTTDFIVHGMLNDVISIAIDNKDNLKLDTEAVLTYEVGDEKYVLPENVLFDLFGKTTDITAADITALDKLPLTYLVMTFGVHPDPNDEGAHEEDKDKEIWVNVSNMVNKQYNVASGDSDLFTISSTEAGGVVTYTISPSSTLRDGTWRSNKIWDLLTSTDNPLIYEEDGEWKVRDIPTIPLDSAAIDNAWNETINP